MGEHFQTVVDLDATPADAAPLADRLVAALVARGIVGADLGDNVLDGTGHAPGPNALDAAADAAGEQRRRFPAAELVTNGMEVLTVRRAVFLPGQVEPLLRCPGCTGDLGLDVWGDQLGEWLEHRPAEVVCPSCGRTAALGRWDGELAFGDLDVRVWNWPPLSEEFLGWVAEQWDGHAVRLVGANL